MRDVFETLILVIVLPSPSPPYNDGNVVHAMLPPFDAVQHTPHRSVTA
jgi:hypothetical protein